MVAVSNVNKYFAKKKKKKWGKKNIAPGDVEFGECEGEVSSEVVHGSLGRVVRKGGENLRLKSGN